MGLRAKITGTGMYVPERVVTNDELAQRMDTTDEWIQQRTGIKERRWITPDESPSDLGKRAVEQALEQAMSIDNVRRHTEGKQIRKVVHIPDRLLNIVVG